MVGPWEQPQVGRPEVDAAVDRAADSGVLVDGFVAPVGEHGGYEGMFSGKKHVSGVNVQVVADLDGRVTDVGDPVPGTRTIRRRSSSPASPNAGAATMPQMGRCPRPTRAQPPTAFESGYFWYAIIGDIPVQAGVVAPAFGQPGGAVMFKLDPGALRQSPPLMTVRWLLREGLLRRVVEPPAAAPGAS